MGNQFLVDARLCERCGKEPRWSTHHKAKLCLNCRVQSRILWDVENRGKYCGAFTTAIRPKVVHEIAKRRGGYFCGICGRLGPPRAGEWDIHHVIPFDEGGKTEWDNLVLAHPECNRGQDNNSPRPEPVEPEVPF